MLSLLLVVEAVSVECIAPGLVVVRGALSDREQQLLANEAHRLGARHVKGFHTETGKLNAGDGRGRMYERSSLLPASFTRLARRVIGAACDTDEAMPDCSPSHCLINYYASSKGLPWHRDIYENDGDGDAPIINLSVGAASTFGVRINGAVRKLDLQSGDAVCFGGPSRYIEHAVLDVRLDERPAWCADACRLSFTFRDAHSVLGRETFFRTFDVRRKWFRETQRAWRPGDGLVDVA